MLSSKLYSFKSNFGFFLKEIMRNCDKIDKKIQTMEPMEAMAI